MKIKIEIGDFRVIHLTFYTSLMRRLVDMTCSGYGYFPEPLNAWYLLLKNTIQQIVASDDQFKKLKFEPPFENLLDNQETLEVCMDEYGLKQFHKFCSDVEEMAITSGIDTDSKKHKELTSILNEFNMFVKNYKSAREKSDKDFEQKLQELKPIFQKVLELEKTGGVSTAQEKNKKGLESILLITECLEPTNTIWLVLDEQFETPIRYSVKNKNGASTYIKKLYDIAYSWDVPNKKVLYNKNLADNINNGLFKKPRVATYMKTNGFKKPTLVQKSESETLVLKNEIPIKTGLIKNIVPLQYQSQYTDKTK